MLTEVAHFRDFRMKMLFDYISSMFIIFNFIQTIIRFIGGGRGEKL